MLGQRGAECRGRNPKGRFCMTTLPKLWGWSLCIGRSKPAPLSEPWCIVITMPKAYPGPGQRLWQLLMLAPLQLQLPSLHPQGHRTPTCSAWASDCSTGIIPDPSSLSAHDAGERVLIANLQLSPTWSDFSDHDVKWGNSSREMTTRCPL